MILCVAPSPAIDVTYRVAGLRVGGTNRVSEVVHRPGGKAVNVARVLTTIGEQALVLAPVAGDSGAWFRAELGLPAALVDAGVPTRRTLTVVDDATGEATLLSEPARVGDWALVAERYAELLPSADVVVVSGSLPFGAPPDAVAGLVRAARRAGKPVIVDTSGHALASAVAAGPTVVKPNAEELAELTGRADPVAAVSALASGSVAVVASLGADGVLAADGSGRWRAHPGKPLRGNPTGAGDALVAGLAAGLADGHRLPDMLTDAVALAAAAVLHPHAGAVDPTEVDRQRAGVVVQPMEAR
ncbi:MAG TPA: hexose kinase [Pseudonocardiaceae bacterium]|nr:hexose kinase [Pseudonocardiaceae bacterium]